MINVTVIEGKDYEFSEDVILHFVESAYVWIIESWFINRVPYPPHAMAKQD